MSEANAIVAADVVLFAKLSESDASVLLIRRRWEPFAGSWALPGGHVEPDESARVAALRKLEEETGIVLATKTPLDYVDYYDDPDRDPRRPRVVSFAFRAALDRPVQPRAGDDAKEAEWVALSLILDGGVSLAFDHRQIIEDAVTAIIDEEQEEVNVGLIKKARGGRPIEAPKTPQERATRIAQGRTRRAKENRKKG